VVLDVRPESEFLAGHISGACAVPIAELGQRLRNLPKGPRSSPTTAARTASTPTKRSKSPDGEGSRRREERRSGVSDTATESGREDTARRSLGRTAWRSVSADGC
jgi:hypothetical protein